MLFRSIFGSGGGAKEAERQKVSLLAEVPLDPLARQGGDEGKPVVLAGSGSTSAAVFKELTNKIIKIMFPSNSR